MMPDEEAMIDPAEYPALARLLNDKLTPKRTRARKEAMDIIADLALAKSEYRARLDAERIDRLVTELGVAWEKVAALHKSAEEHEKEIEGHRCKLVEHGLLCDGNHPAPACKDAECWHRTPSDSIPKECGCIKVGAKIETFAPDCPIHGNPGTPCTVCDAHARPEDGGKSVWIKDEAKYLWRCADCAVGF